MFCENCGMRNPDSAAFCENCGQRIVTPAATAETWSTPGWSTATAGGYTATTTSGNNSALKIIIAIAVAVLVAVSGIIGACSMTKGYEKPFDYVEQHFNKRDMDVIKKALPKQYNEDGNTTTISKYRYDFYESCYGVDFKIKYKIISKSKCSDNEIAELEEEMNGELNGKGEFIDVKNGYLLRVQKTIEGDRDRDIETVDVYVVKVGGKWYIGGYDEINKL